MTRLTVLGICVMLIGCSTKTPPTAPSGSAQLNRSDDQETTNPSLPFISIWVENWGWAPDNSGLIAAIWADGRIVWSNDSVKGGPPYKEAKVDVDAVFALVSDLSESGTLAKDEFKSPHFGPDSSFTVINIRHKHASFSLTSWHDIAEAGSDTVVGASYGLTSTGDKTREEFLKDEPKEYLEFRDVWQRIRDTVNKSLPNDGVEVTATIKTRDRDLGEKEWAPDSK